MKEIWKNAWLHVLAVILFFTLSFAYFTPLLEGKVLYQSDIANYRGMSKEIWDHREAYGEEPLWTNSLFAGMPAYFNSVRYPGNLIHTVFFEPVKAIPAPANYLFLLFLGFYVLLAGLKYNPRLAFAGALALNSEAGNLESSALAKTLKWQPWYFLLCLIIFSLVIAKNRARMKNGAASPMKSV